MILISTHQKQTLLILINVRNLRFATYVNIHQIKAIQNQTTLDKRGKLSVLETVLIPESGYLPFLMFVSDRTSCSPGWPYTHSWPFYLGSARMIGMYYHTVVGIKPRPSWMPGKHSTSWAASPVTRIGVVEVCCLAFSAEAPHARQVLHHLQHLQPLQDFKGKRYHRVSECTPMK